MLGEQLAKLNAEVEDVEMRFGFDYGHAAINPSKLGLLLEQHSRQLCAELSLQ